MARVIQTRRGFPLGSYSPWYAHAYAWHRLYNGWDVKGDAALGDVLRQLRLCFPAVLLKEGPLAFLCASSGVKYSGPHSIEPEIGLRVPRNQAPCELHRLQPEENHDA